MSSSNRIGGDRFARGILCRLGVFQGPAIVSSGCFSGVNNCVVWVFFSGQQLCLSGVFAGSTFFLKFGCNRQSLFFLTFTRV